MPDRALLLLLLVACGSDPAPYDPLASLRVGVDPPIEAHAVSDTLVRSGYALVDSLDARTYSARTLYREADRRSAIRVVTWRGLALAADAPNERSERIGLVSLSTTSNYDLDRDGEEELLISNVKELEHCIEVLHVGDDGLVRASTMRLPRSLSGCVVEIRDIDDDDFLEALGLLRPIAPLDLVPDVEIAVAFHVRGHALEVASLPLFSAGERARREDELTTARTARDATTAIRIATELALIAKVGGEEVAEQLAWFDRAASGLVLTEPQAEMLRAMRDALAEE